jgi:type I restriction enzyme R subunit
VIDPGEQAVAVAALLSGEFKNQNAVYAALDPAVRRYEGLEDDDQVEFFSALQSYVRAYAFLAQLMPWSERDLEELYLYGKALLQVLPRKGTDPLPQLSDTVLLTHLRNEVIAAEEVLSLEKGTDEPGNAFTGGGQGKRVEPPTDLLSAIIGRINDQFGMNLTDADRIWIEQQKQTVKENDEARIVALNNDFDQYRIVLERMAEDMIVDRHQANGALFDAFFDKPGFREWLIQYLGTTYEEFRQEGAS